MILEVDIPNLMYNCIQWSTYGGTEVTYISFYLSRAHDILSRH